MKNSDADDRMCYTIKYQKDSSAGDNKVERIRFVVFNYMGQSRFRQGSCSWRSYPQAMRQIAKLKINAEDNLAYAA